MREASPRKERALGYNIYSDEDRQRYFYFLQEKLMTPIASYQCPLQDCSKMEDIIQ